MRHLWFLKMRHFLVCLTFMSLSLLFEILKFKFHLNVNILGALTSDSRSYRLLELRVATASLEE